MGISYTLARGDTQNQNKYEEKESGLRAEQEAHRCFRGHPESKYPQREQGRSNLKSPMGPSLRVAPKGTGEAKPLDLQQGGFLCVHRSPFLRLEEADLQ